MIKAIIFDFDGTIANTFPIVIEAVNKLSSKYRYPLLTDSPILRSKSMREIVKKDLKLSILKLPGYLNRLKLKIAEKISDVYIFPGIKKITQELLKHYSLIILTTNSKNTVQEIFQKNKINISQIYSDNSLFGKARQIKKILKLQKLRKNEVVYVADEIRDIEACKKAGIKIIAVSWGYNSREIIEKNYPDFIADKPEDIPKIIDSIK